MELDFSRSLHYFWALMPEMILCAWGMVVLLAGVSRSQKEAAAAEGGDPSFGGAADLGWLALGGVLVGGEAALADVRDDGEGLDEAVVKIGTA